MALELSPANQESSYHTVPGGNIAVIQPQADRTWMSKVEEPVRTKTLCHICRTLLSTGELLTTLTACASRSQEFHIL